MRESKIEKYFTHRIKTVGGMAIKFVSPGLTGVPDRMVLIRGRVIFVELKAPTGRVTKRQALMHRKLQGLGFRVEVIRSMLEVDRFIASLLFEEVKDGVSAVPIPGGSDQVDL